MYKKSYTTLNLFYRYFAMLLIVIIAMTRRAKANPTNKNNEKCVKSESANTDKIIELAQRLGANKRLSIIIAAHSYIETGNYTSNIFRSCNNLFGMGRVYSRQNKQCGYKDFGARVDEPRFMGCYETLTDSITDWFQWFATWGKSVGDLNNMNLRQILTFMKSKKYFVIGLNEYHQRVGEVYSELKRKYA